MQQCSGGGAPHGNADEAKGDDDVADMCQSIAGPPVDEAIGMLVVEQMTPPAVELALEVRKEIQARHEEAGRLRCRAIERAQTEAELAQRRFMLVDPGNRLVADTLEGEWNGKLRTLASAREERERGREHDQFILNKAVHERLVAMTAHFNALWKDPDTPNRKRLMAHIIEDVHSLKTAGGLNHQVSRSLQGWQNIQTVTTMNPSPPLSRYLQLCSVVGPSAAHVTRDHVNASILVGRKPACTFIYDPTQEPVLQPTWQISRRYTCRN